MTSKENVEIAQEILDRNDTVQNASDAFRLCTSQFNAGAAINNEEVMD